MYSWRFEIDRGILNNLMQLHIYCECGYAMSLCALTLASNTNFPLSLLSLFLALFSLSLIHLVRCYSIFCLLLSLSTWTQALAKRGGGLGWISICSDKRELSSICLLFFFYLFPDTTYSVNSIQPLFTSYIIIVL